MKKSMLGVLAVAVLFAVEAQAQVQGSAQYAPRNLSATVVGETGVNVTWDHPEAPYVSIEYDVYAEPVGGGSGAVTRENSTSGTSFNFTGLTPGTAYRIRVSPNARVNENGRTVPVIGDSASTTVRTGGTSPTPPAAPDPPTAPEPPAAPDPPTGESYAPRNLSATVVGETGVNVTWDHPTASYVSIEYDIRADPVGGSGVTRDNSTTGTSFTFRGLTPGTDYRITVSSHPRVRNENGGVSPVTGGAAITTVRTGGESPSPPTEPEPENRVCRYEHRLNTVPGTTAGSHHEWIRITSRVDDATVRIRAYHFEDGRSLDVVDVEDEVIGSTTTLGSANSIKRFRIEGVSGWHSVVVAHGITTTDGMNGVTVSMAVRGPEGRLIVPAQVVEHCTTTTTQAN